MQALRRIDPPLTLLQGFPYRPAAQTDVTQTWARYGWHPPSRQRQQRIRNWLNPVRMEVAA
jgi:hypothetical protein